MDKKIIEQNKNTFKETLEQFENCLGNFKNLSKNDKNLANKVVDDWKSRLNDDNWIQNFIRIKNSQTIFEFKNELSYKLSFNDLIDKVAQCFGEIDCAKHLIREFPQKINDTDVQIEKILKQKSSPSCDFKVYTLIPHLVEVKTIGKFNELKISQYTRKALKQIEGSGSKDSYYGVVWIFTWDIPKDFTGAQSMIEKVKRSITKPFKYTLTVQIYCLGLWGDSTFRIT